MVFVLWYSPNHTPIKYRCPIKKNKCLNNTHMPWTLMPAPNGTSMMKSHSPKSCCPLSRVGSILVMKTKQEEYQLVMWAKWVRLGHLEGWVRWLVIIRKIWIWKPGRPLKASDARNVIPWMSLWAAPTNYFCRCQVFMEMLTISCAFL